jgi:hypothetical protein
VLAPVTPDRDPMAEAASAETESPEPAVRGFVFKAGAG